MFDLARLISQLPPTNKPLRIAARQLHWFRAAFKAHAAQCGDVTRCRFEIDDIKVAKAFVRWLENIEKQRPNQKADRYDFFEFAPSLMLNELVSDMPVKLVPPLQVSSPESPFEFWPEGYVTTTFCITVYAATMDQEFGTKVEVDKAIDDLRFWWSFRENTVEDSKYASAFFQKLFGKEPNWLFPASFGARAS